VVPLISIFSLLLCTAVVATYAVRVVRHGRTRHARLGDAPGSALCPGWLVESFYWVLAAIGRGLARLGVAPDVLTYLALAFSLASAPLVASGHMPEGALCVAAGGILDVLDGLVARARGRASAAGAVLDAVVDRVSDAAPFVGLAVFYRAEVGTLLVPLAALVASSLVSYARARAEAQGLALPSGLMRRHERIAYLLLALLLGPLVPPPAAAPTLRCPATLAGLAFIAVGGVVAAIVLVVKARAALAAPARPAEPDRPRPAVRPREHEITIR
jgi:CDP-diacylglycerol--glycerol-3-phosphate 3-phosphatidyltransferase